MQVDKSETVRITWRAEPSSDRKYVFCNISIETPQGVIGNNTWCLGQALINSISELLKILKSQKETCVSVSMFEEYNQTSIFSSLIQHLKTRRSKAVCFYEYIQNVEKIDFSYIPYMAVPYGVENFDVLQAFIIRLNDNSAYLMWRTNADNKLQYLTVDYNEYISMWDECFVAISLKISEIISKNEAIKQSGTDPKTAPP